MSKESEAIKRNYDDLIEAERMIDTARTLLRRCAVRRIFLSSESRILSIALESLCKASEVVSALRGVIASTSI